MDQKHELLCALKDLALELGRTPTRDEFTKLVRGRKQQVELAFGGFGPLLQASGLASIPRKMKITSEQIFGRDIEQVIKEHAPKLAGAEYTGEFKSILVIGDAHFPFAHQPTLDKIYKLAAQKKYGFIVQIGDLYDLYAHSRFPRSQNIYGPDQEIDLARSQAETFWKTLQAACPSAKCHQILGNHDLRPMKKVLERAPELETIILRGIRPYYEFEGVETLHDYRQELIIQGVAFHHGYLSQLGAHATHGSRSIVVGHTHRGGTVFKAMADGKIIWELNVGFIGDETSKVMGYTPTKTTNWTLGVGEIDSLGPRFIPL